MDRTSLGSFASSLPRFLALGKQGTKCIHLADDFNWGLCSRKAHIISILKNARAYFPGLVILHCAVADGNSTRSPENEGLLCGGSQDNCSATTTQSKWNDHFSPCPTQYEHYCINGRCRFVEALQTPSCLCDEGYAGTRCEKVDYFYLRGDTGQIVVICLIAVMVALIILAVGVCTCCHPLRRKKKEDIPNLDKDITPVNEDIQETSIA